jgi:hypothetical protein
MLAVPGWWTVNDHDRVIAALATVPEKELKIIQLARELVGENGQLDHEKAAQRAPEVNLAVAEAGAYARTTAQAIQALRDIAPRTA